MFITNNHASFHLWWEEHLLKYQKVSKYCDHQSLCGYYGIWCGFLPNSFSGFKIQSSAFLYVLPNCSTSAFLYVLPNFSTFSVCLTKFFHVFNMSSQIFPRFLYVLPYFSTFSIYLTKFFHVFYMSYLLKVNNRNTRTMCEICSKLTIGVVLVSSLLTLYVFATLFYCFYC